MLGDDMPPDELNSAPRIRLHFGYPYCHGMGISDPEFGKNKNCDDYVSPKKNLGPHVAGLGMRFYTGAMFPTGNYKNQIFIAEHGSWNRTIPLRLSNLARKTGERSSRHLRHVLRRMAPRPRSVGPPVDVLVMPDGALLVSARFGRA